MDVGSIMGAPGLGGPALATLSGEAAVRGDVRPVNADADALKAVATPRAGAALRAVGMTPGPKSVVLEVVTV